jgi:ComF family protein
MCLINQVKNCLLASEKHVKNVKLKILGIRNKMLYKINDFLLDIIFPKRCVCGKWDTLICEECFKEISQEKTQLCPICKKLSGNGKTCSSCRAKSNLTGVMILGEHKGKLKQFIWEYKYNFKRDLGAPLGRILADRFGNFIIQKNFLITTVPISKKRKNWRGFNQSELLARQLSVSLNVEYGGLLTKMNTKSQVGLGRKDRIKNIKKSIRLKDGDKIIKKILLVDDVYTSGATLEECAKVLREAGAREVWGLVLSRE